MGSDPARIVSEVRRILGGESKASRIPELWDGYAAERIVAVLRERLSRKKVLIFLGKRYIM